MGADYWATILIPDPSEYLAHEMIHLTSSDYINVYLVNTGHGYPFITALELRLLDITMYKDQSRSLISVQRSNFGTTETVRNLSSRRLSGGIATVSANLTMIESLDLSYKNLTGNVQEFLAQLDNLRILNLTGNNFTRPFPTELLAKSKKGLLWLSTEESSGEESRNNKHNIVVILAPFGSVVVFSIIIIFTVKQLQKKGLGFGSVFRGSVGDNQVAVKMLSESSSLGYKEFQTEVKILMKIHHKNITSLVGYCDDSNHKAIIYEFMANGNLDKHLFDECPNVLSWERRLQIGCDAAEG
ncbi:hypothetical protein L1987_87853 [Smallanthus sonchifolius]|nr:hypothetical protein L1987_87853 [Smallanthus sonchifolius]